MCTSSASGTIKLNLANSLSRLRALLPQQPLEDAAQNEDERAALRTIIDRAATVWTATLGSAPSATDLARLLRLIHVQTLNMEHGQSGLLEAQALLRSSVLLRPETSEIAWAQLLSLAAHMAQTSQRRGSPATSARTGGFGA